MNRFLAPAILVFCAATSFGANSYWSNTSGGTYSTGGNWQGGVPGNTDSGIFTNTTSFSVQWSGAAAVANASFRGTGQFTQNIQSASWTIRTNYSVGAVPNAHATVVHTTGTLNVSNPVHTAQMVIGSNGWGNYVLRGGTLNVDSLICTNGTNANFAFSHGTLETRYSEISLTESPEMVWRIGSGDNQVANWRMVGTNVLSGSSQVSVRLGHTDGTRGQLTVTGTDACFDMWDKQLVLGGNGVTGSVFVVSNGATATLNDLELEGGSETNSIGQRVVVTGAASVLNANFFQFNFGAGSSLLVSNGATLNNIDGGIFGYGGLMLVTGTNSILTSHAVSIADTNNQLMISNGAGLVGSVNVDGINTAFRVIGATADIWSLNINSEVELRQATVSVNNVLFIHESGKLNFTSGTLTSELEFRNDSTNGPLVYGGDSNIASLVLNGPYNNVNDPPLSFILASNASFTLTGTMLSSLFVATNGPSNSVRFTQGDWTTESTLIQMGRPFEVGDGTNVARLTFAGGNHLFANGLRLRAESTVASSDSITITGNVTNDSQSDWICDMPDRVASQSQPNLAVIGNLAIHGNINLAGLTGFVPARYVIATYTGVLNTNGATLVHGLPATFSVRLDTSVAGQLAVDVKFIGPIPSNTLANVALAGTNCSVSFLATNNATHQVEFSDSLSPATWQPLVTVTNFSGIASVVDTNATAWQRFYRLRTNQP